jgi:hypothetical protein
MKILSKAIGLTLAATLAGCATTPPPYQAETQLTGGDDAGCNTVAAAAVGALFGALLGGGDHRGAGAALGGAIGAATCLAVNYRTTQVKSAQQVNREYISSNGGSLPEHATLVRFDSRFHPTNTLQAGGSSALVSYIEVATGRDGVQPKIAEEVTLFGPDGKQLKTMRKAASSGATAGAFQTQFQFTMPQGIPQGVYPFKTALYLDGRKVSEGHAELQIVSTESEITLAAR